jgi:hypothetical protein
VPFDRQGSALPPKKRTKLISVPVDGVNLRYGSVPDTKIERRARSDQAPAHDYTALSQVRTPGQKRPISPVLLKSAWEPKYTRFVDGRHLAD